MEKVMNRIGRLILLLTIAGSYVMWVVGIDTDITSFMYGNSMHLLLAAIVLILLLNITQLKLEDWMILALAVGTWVLYFLTSDLRQSTPEINGTIPILILLVLCFKICLFDKIDRTILLAIVLAALIVTLYRIYTELPKIIPVDEIFKESNKLEIIWINTNTIGATLLFSTLMSSLLIKSYNIKFLNILLIPIYVGGLIGTWVCQSKTSVIILIAFILFDNLIPKSFLQKTKFWLLSFAVVVIGGPVLFYFCSQSETIDLFTGRERIWQEFFTKWLSNGEHIRIGMAPFTASWKQLGIHNGFLYTLASFGVIGYIILFGFLLYMIFRIGFQNKQLTRLQVGLFIAFLMIWCHSFMENIILAYQWMPIVYSFLGLAFVHIQVRERKGRHSGNEKTSSSSRMKKYHK